jgi:hypothetical protein
MTEKADEFLEALLQSASFDEDAEYIQRGCPYSEDSDDVLSARWVSSFKSLMGRHSEEQAQILGDCNAEMRRRDLEAPGDQVSAEIAQVQEQIRENSQDPEVLKAIADFRRRLRSPDA